MENRANQKIAFERIDLHIFPGVWILPFSNLNKEREISKKNHSILILFPSFDIIIGKLYKNNLTLGVPKYWTKISIVKNQKGPSGMKYYKPIQVQWAKNQVIWTYFSGWSVRLKFLFIYSLSTTRSKIKLRRSTFFT